ncbi:SPRY domain-containing SOCS box protein 3 [Trichonephila inaurata madagascariensis]|uniref:SPRY domain-containing SOCS box protein 3 n=1 Tax=Trichonephila inaurata madagascariensis TaxID=2747483 RepID=A0A8X6YH20_9ARAC|nr:SPRY domain-containing SOCS box protein 3 [Trichonephila inaurata madagascariensis]
MLEATYGIGKDSEIEIPREEIDPSDQVEWTWDESNDKDFVVLLNNNRDVTFHRDMSGGTAVVRGTQPIGLKGKTMYAMACSTAACSRMRIVRSCSFPSSLQFICCTKLRELIPDEKNVLREIHLPPGLRDFLENHLGWLLESRATESNIQVIPSRRNACWEYYPRCYSVKRVQIAELGRIELGRIVNVVRTPFISNSSVVRMFSHNPTARSESPQLIVNVGNDDIQEDSSSSVPQNPLRQNIHSETEHHSSVGESSKSVIEEGMEELPALLDSRDPIESEAKRRRCSYNYTLGLSDPDSE